MSLTSDFISASLSVLVLLPGDFEDILRDLNLLALFFFFDIGSGLEEQQPIETPFIFFYILHTDSL